MFRRNPGRVVPDRPTGETDVSVGTNSQAVGLCSVLCAFARVESLRKIRYEELFNLAEDFAADGWPNRPRQFNPDRVPLSGGVRRHRADPVAIVAEGLSLCPLFRVALD